MVIRSSISPAESETGSRRAALLDGIGAGWRPEIAYALDRWPRLAFVEVIAEDLDPDGPVPSALEDLRQRGLPVIPHGVSLGLGDAGHPDAARVGRLARLAERLQAPLVSEHIAFVRAAGRETGHLLPIPRTREALGILVENVQEAQSQLPVPLALENIAALFDWPGAELDETAFLEELLDRTGCWLLLDIANVYANARNQQKDPLESIQRLPLERVAYAHVAGGVVENGRYHDSHTRPPSPDLLDLVTETCRRAQPHNFGVLLERDDDFPASGGIEAELEAIAAAVESGRSR